MHARFHWRLWVYMCTLVAVCVCEGVNDPLAADDGLPDVLDDERQETRSAAPRAYGGGGLNGLAPGGFRPAAAAPLAELAGYTRPRQQQQHQRQQQQQQELEEEEEREEPDRLAQLLQQSRFDCSTKPGGYYADQELACEVFHYCQDGVKHSWICPDGFTFHQVHLICMPPTHDNLCQQSAKYHFVNEYLYRPVNEQEHARRPDLPLQYADRYYPREVYHDDRQEPDDDEEQPQASGAARAQQGAGAGAGARPQQTHVFRSAEAVNIPLGQRRPPPPQPQYDADF